VIRKSKLIRLEHYAGRSRAVYYDMGQLISNEWRSDVDDPRMVDDVIQTLLHSKTLLKDKRLPTYTFEITHNKYISLSVYKNV